MNLMLELMICTPMVMLVIVEVELISTKDFENKINWSKCRCHCP